MSNIDHVDEFVEKPPVSTAKELLNWGGLWNTLIIAGTVDSFWKQAQKHMPLQTMLFSAYADVLAQEESDEARKALLRQLYQSIPIADFSIALLQQMEGMMVVKMKESGWSDCGTPDRLLSILSKAAHFPSQWMKRVRNAANSPLRGTMSPDHGG